MSKPPFGLSLSKPSGKARPPERHRVIGVLCAFVALWWAASHAGWVSRVFLPTPEATLASLRDGFNLAGDGEGELGSYALATTLRMVEGWLLASLIGIALGAAIGISAPVLEIVVVNTRAGSRYGHADCAASGAGMGYEATMYLLERGVRLTGTDAWSWDAPFVHTAKKYGESKDASLIWEGHKAGREIGYCHIEKLHYLEALPPTGFFISCFPHKIRGASAGWTRAVAIFDDALMATA